ncbi:WD and tetratricopeptide repeat protein [Desmophyllum pertusum]|uniref:WD and tetratricopeptide repeat protein n=1 Tax=Desmophyllum pertusum TaxID=174260 RepID=A0A9W9Y7Y0_9CNID|nr:WD and tetratricopeptide repeat protein [Desmophyllum pertusum]
MSRDMDAHNIAAFIRNREVKSSITRAFQRRFQLHPPFVERLGLETETRGFNLQESLSLIIASMNNTGKET